MSFHRRGDSSSRRLCHLSLLVNSLLCKRQKPKSNQLQQKNQLAGGSELSGNSYGFSVSGVAVSRRSIKVIKYLFSLSLHSAVLCGLNSPKSLPKHKQSSFGYTSIGLAMPGERGHLPELPTNVLSLTSPSPDPSLWPGSYELSN